MRCESGAGEQGWGVGKGLPGGARYKGRNMKTFVHGAWATPFWAALQFKFEFTISLLFVGCSHIGGDRPVEVRSSAL